LFGLLIPSNLVAIPSKKKKKKLSG
jgi:hypothetical protein